MKNQKEETGLEVTGNSFIAKSGLYHLKKVRASPLGALDYRVNAKGVDKKQNPDLISVQGTVLFEDDGALTTEFTAQIIAYNQIDCSDKILFSQLHEKTKLWCEILFLNKRNAVSSLFIKGHSFDNLKNYIKGLQMNRDEVTFINQVITKVVALKMENEFGTYYVLDFTYEGEPEKEVIEDLEVIFDPKNPLGMEVLQKAPRYPDSVKIIKRN